MTIRRRVDKRRLALPADVLDYFAERSCTRPPLLFFGDELELWDVVRDDVVAEWVIERAGTRPAVWWRHDAPEPRQRLGGRGDPLWEHLAVLPTFEHGIPASWVEGWHVDFYTGKAVDKHGAPIGQEFVGNDFRGVAIDPENPPVYESQATYLERLGLLLPGERRRIEAVDFEPEAVDA